ncbi:MAG TPA: alginate lyase family protein [Pyrinomonadaceae bacterium]|nr:alginate lyase family protein [Pyrinomonadaceae bacterium]
MNLRRLKDATIDELRVRAAQRIAAFSERRGWSPLAKLPADEEFSSLFTAPVADLLEHFRSRSEPKFFASFNSPQETVDAFNARWPNVAQRLIEKADRICDGKFDLLGCTNLDFGDPIDWHFEPCTGKRIPLMHWSKLDYLNAGIAGDKKIIWELNRHQYFVTLGQAYLCTGDERYATAFATHLDAWMDANPPKLGINWTSSLEVAFRSMSWLWGFYFFKSSPALATETFQRACKFLYLSARHLESYLSTYFSPNTHLTGEALGLFFLGTLLPEFKEAKRWQELGSQILVDQLPVHVRSDGVYFEQSSYYHRYTTDFYLHFQLLSRANKFKLPAQVEHSLVRLLDHLMYIQRPDGTTPLVGDDDGGRLAMLDVRDANDFRGTLGVGSVVFDRGDYKFVAGDAAEVLLWLTGPEGLRRFDVMHETQPLATSKGFHEGGYFVMRDGWTSDSNYLLFDCGPHGSLSCGHAHADALSFDLASRGRTILVDPGTYIYTGSKEMRDWFRSSAAHNTLTIDGESSSVPLGPFSWKHIAQARQLQWISRTQFDFVSGKHDGYERLAAPATHTRQILFLKAKYWIIRDLVATTGAHRYDLDFHFATNTNPSIDADGRAVHECAGNLPGLGVFVFGAEGKWRQEDGWISTNYRERSLAPVCTFTVEAEGGQEFVTFMVPRAERQDQVSVSILDHVTGNAFEVRDMQTRDVLLMGQGQSLEAGLDSDFQLAWMRFGESSSLDELVLIGGRRLIVAGQEIINSSQFINYVEGRRVGDEIRCDTVY